MPSGTDNQDLRRGKIALGYQLPKIVIRVLRFIHLSAHASTLHLLSQTLWVKARQAEMPIHDKQAQSDIHHCHKGSEDSILLTQGMLTALAPGYPKSDCP